MRSFASNWSQSPRPPLRPSVDASDDPTQDASAACSDRSRPSPDPPEISVSVEKAPPGRSRRRATERHFRLFTLAQSSTTVDPATNSDASPPCTRAERMAILCASFEAEGGAVWKTPS